MTKTGVDLALYGRCSEDDLSKVEDEEAPGDEAGECEEEEEPEEDACV